MAFRIRTPDGLVVEVDNPHELAIVLDMIRPSKIPEARTERQPTQPAQTIPLEASVVHRFLNTLSDKQQSVVRVLAQSTDGMLDNEIVTALNLPSKNSLGGLMAGISRHAGKGHLIIEQVLVKSVRQNGTGTLHNHYVATPAVKEAIAREANSH